MSQILKEVVAKKVEEYKQTESDIIQIRIKIFEHFKHFNQGQVVKILNQLKVKPKKPQMTKRVTLKNPSQYVKGGIWNEETKRYEKVFGEHKFSYQCLGCNFIHDFQSDAEECFREHESTKIEPRQLTVNHFNDLTLTEENNQLFKVGKIIQWRFIYNSFEEQDTYGVYECEIVNHEIIKRIDAYGKDQSWHKVDVKVLKLLSIDEKSYNDRSR